MIRVRHALAFISMLAVTTASVASCSLLQGVAGVVDAPCRDRPDALDCQAALEVGRAAVGVDLEDGYDVRMNPVECDETKCSTWLEATPLEGQRPSWSVSLVRPTDGAWAVELLSHGDPPCAFDQAGCAP